MESQLHYVYNNNKHECECVFVCTCVVRICIIVLNVNWIESAVATVMELVRNNNFHVCNDIIAVYLRCYFIIIRNNTIRGRAII